MSALDARHVELRSEPHRVARDRAVAFELADAILNGPRATRSCLASAATLVRALPRSRPINW
jgi:hypothetical protein